MRTKLWLVAAIVVVAASCNPPQKYTNHAAGERAEPGPKVNNESKTHEPKAVVTGDSEDQGLAAALAKLKRGHLAYSVPEKLKTDQTGHIVASLATESVSSQTLRSQLPNGKDGVVSEEKTPISTRMKMTLKSADFEITPLSSEEQSVGEESPTTWEWDIVPKHSGKYACISQPS